MLVNEDRLRDSVRITRTPRDKGWQTTVKLSIYDNGIVSLNDLPLNPNPSQGGDVADERMPTALAVIVDEFKRQVYAQATRTGPDDDRYEDPVQRLKRLQEQMQQLEQEQETEAKYPVRPGSDPGPPDIWDASFGR